MGQNLSLASANTLLIPSAAFLSSLPRLDQQGWGGGEGEVKLLPEEAMAWPEEEVGTTAATFNGLQCPGVSPVSPHGQGGASVDLFFRFLPSWVLSTPGKLSVPLLCAHRGTEGVDLLSLLQSRLALSPIPLLLRVSALVLG